MLVDSIISTVVGGLTLGSLYALVALGLTIIWGTLEIYNFAHGAFVAVGAYITWTLLYLAGVPFLLSAILTLVISFFLGIVMYELAIKRVSSNLMIVVICTMMISTFVENTLLLVIPEGALIKRLPVILDAVYRVGFITINGTELVYTVVAAAVLVFLWLFLKKTRTGLAIRAVNQDKDGAYLMGINVVYICMFIVGLASCLAALVGIFLGSKEVMTPTMGSWPMWKASVIALFGGLGSIKGTVIAAFVISEIESLTALFFGNQWVTPVLFSFLMVLLMLRPTGI
jgi:branched-chain amino acid transport system permease protein